MRRRFEKGTVSVTELNTAQQEKESANAQYISQLRSFWVDYYSLQKSTLYDWVQNKDIDVDFDKLLK
jgi:outer membrane protein TolC